MTSYLSLDTWIVAVEYCDKMMSSFATGNETVPTSIPFKGHNPCDTTTTIIDQLSNRLEMLCEASSRREKMSAGDSILSKHAQIRSVEKDNSIDTAQATLDKFIPQVSSPLEKRPDSKPICFSWRDKGSCSHGAKCRFADSHVAKSVEKKSEKKVDTVSGQVEVKETKIETPKQILLKELLTKPCEIMHVKLLNKQVSRSTSVKVLMYMASWFKPARVALTAIVLYCVKQVPIAKWLSFVSCPKQQSDVYCRVVSTLKSVGTLVHNNLYTVAAIAGVGCAAGIAAYYYWQNTQGKVDEYEQTSTSHGFVDTIALSPNPNDDSGYSPLALLGGGSLEVVECDRTMLEYLRQKEGMIKPTKFTQLRFSQELQQHYSVSRTQRLIFDTARVYHQEMEFMRVQSSVTTFCGTGVEQL